MGGERATHYCVLCIVDRIFNMTISREKRGRERDRERERAIR